MAARGIATIVLSRKHISSSQNFIGDFVASITVAVSEKKIICTIDTRHTNTRAFMLMATLAAVPFITRTGRNISAIPTGIDGAIAAASGT